MVSCIAHVNRWMISNRLKLNTDNTNCILLGNRQPLEKVNLRTNHLNGVHVAVSNTATCLAFSSTASSHSLYTLTVWLDLAFISFVSFAAFVTLAQSRRQKCSSMPSSSAAWIIVTVSSIRRAPYICVFSSLLSSQVLVWSLSGGNTITSHTPFVMSCTGYLSNRGSPANCAFSTIRVCIVMIHRRSSVAFIAIGTELTGPRDMNATRNGQR